jgi:hypothetical protein
MVTIISANTKWLFLGPQKLSEMFKVVENNIHKSPKMNNIHPTFSLLDEYISIVQTNLTSNAQYW